MAYNLGADPTHNTPKKQMAYLAGVTSSNNSWEVFGDFYQWGRSGKGADNGYQVRTSSNVAINSGTITYDALTGQPTSAAHIGRFISNIPPLYDWRVPTSSSGTQCTSGSQCDTLWGNGKAISTATPGGGWPGIGANTGNTYQMPYKTINDPCPDGYRVPTQDDWERLGNYCNPANARDYGVSLSGFWHTNTGFTWVAVRCGAAVESTCKATNQSWTTASPGGYAIYHTHEWNASGLTTNSDLLLPGTPEPLLFLPATGFRSSSNQGYFVGVGSDATYWSSTLTGLGSAHKLLFNNTYVGPESSSNRGDGYSVRCVAE
jgi:hypothetical protein